MPATIGATTLLALVAGLLAVEVDPAPRSTADASEPAVASAAVESSATATAHALRIGNQHRADPLTPLRSPDAGDHCSAGLSATDLATFFAAPIGRFQGGDYQRAVRLPDDRVLWTFQDAFIDGQLVHNAAFVQSGRCFTLLNRGTHSWLLADRTTSMVRWHWILDGAIGWRRDQITLFVVEMNETGPTYLSRTRPTAMRRVVVDAVSLQPIAVHDVAPTGEDLYGWSITNDTRYTYLYSHCYQQFGYEGMFGFGPCVAEVKVARVPIGQLDSPRQYWNGSEWTADHTQSRPVVDGTFVVSGNNPAQMRYDGRRFVLVEKRDDWWGTTVEFGTSTSPTGPFTHRASLPHPVACDPSVCNTYFASWIPWRQADGALIWSIGRNVWDGATTWTQLHRYRPTFGTIALS